MHENMAKKNDVTALKIRMSGGILSAVAVGAAVPAVAVQGILQSLAYLQHKQKFFSF